MTDIARDFPDIARRAKDLRDGKLPDLSRAASCRHCRGSGWAAITKPTGTSFQVCFSCRNPQDRPKPSIPFCF